MTRLGEVTGCPEPPVGGSARGCEGTPPLTTGPEPVSVPLDSLVAGRLGFPLTAPTDCDAEADGRGADGRGAEPLPGVDGRDPDVPDGAGAEIDTDADGAVGLLGGAVVGGAGGAVVGGAVVGGAGLVGGGVGVFTGGAGCAALQLSEMSVDVTAPSTPITRT